MNKENSCGSSNTEGLRVDDQKHGLKTIGEGHPSQITKCQHEAKPIMDYIHCAKYCLLQTRHLTDDQSLDLESNKNSPINVTIKQPQPSQLDKDVSSSGRLGAASLLEAPPPDELAPPTVILGAAKACLTSVTQEVVWILPVVCDGNDLEPSLKESYPPPPSLPVSSARPERTSSPVGIHCLGIGLQLQALIKPSRQLKQELQLTQEGVNTYRDARRQAVVELEHIVNPPPLGRVGVRRAVVPGELTKLQTQEDMLLFHVHDIYSFQTDADVHTLSTTSVKEALRRLDRSVMWNSTSDVESENGLGEVTHDGADKSTLRDVFCRGFCKAVQQVLPLTAKLDERYGPPTLHPADRKLFKFLTCLHELSETLLDDRRSTVDVLLFTFQSLKFTQHVLIGVLQTLARNQHRETNIKPDKRATRTDRDEGGEDRDGSRPFIRPQQRRTVTAGEITGRAGFKRTGSDIITLSKSSALKSGSSSANGGLSAIYIAFAASLGIDEGGFVGGAENGCGGGTVPMSSSLHLEVSTGCPPDVTSDDFPVGPRLEDKNIWCQFGTMWEEKPQGMGVGKQEQRERQLLRQKREEMDWESEEKGTALHTEHPDLVCSAEEQALSGGRGGRERAGEGMERVVGLGGVGNGGRDGRTRFWAVLGAGFERAPAAGFLLLVTRLFIEAGLFSREREARRGTCDAEIQRKREGELLDVRKTLIGTGTGSLILLFIALIEVIEVPDVCWFHTHQTRKTLHVLIPAEEANLSSRMWSSVRTHVALPSLRNTQDKDSLREASTTFTERGFILSIRSVCECVALANFFMFKSTDAKTFRLPLAVSCKRYKKAVSFQNKQRTFMTATKTNNNEELSSGRSGEMFFTRSPSRAAAHAAQGHRTVAIEHRYHVRKLLHHVTHHSKRQMIRYMVLSPEGTSVWKRDSWVRAGLTMSFLSTARAASSPAGFLRARLSATRDWLMSAWMRDPPLEFRMPLSPLGNGGNPSMVQTLPAVSRELQFFQATQRLGTAPDQTAQLDTGLHRHRVLELLGGPSEFVQHCFLCTGQGRVLLVERACQGSYRGSRLESRVGWWQEWGDYTGDRQRSGLDRGKWSSEARSSPLTVFWPGLASYRCRGFTR
ncbi:hypothetical protein DNTS_022819 [Danionella cerebrum]|uniref:Uncharacterized protein n=1 Tax=Danionella cerebrum TaxID=2873325 RepID=A0A553RAP4_9TELE|nr:hypothetical protein DNTS_022819 [Danionella translucida]